MKPSKNLAEIQSDIQQAVKQSTTPASLASLIREKPPLSIPDRMKIYQEAYRIRLLESLHDDFARVLEHAGQSKFETLCLEFIVKQPSTYADLGQWSQHFSDFLSDKSPELNQLASMDWLEILSSRAPERRQAALRLPMKSNAAKVLSCARSQPLVLLTFKADPT
jgi:hypothetical protein